MVMYDCILLEKVFVIFWVVIEFYRISYGNFYVLIGFIFNVGKSIVIEVV